MKAVLLVAGKGERLRPVTSSRPKPLVPILCRPLLYWHLDALSRVNGVDEIIVVASYKKEMVEDAVTRWSLEAGRGPRVKVIDQGRELGTGDAVAKALKYVDDMEDVIIVYGDLFLSDWSVYSRLSRTGGNALAIVEHSRPQDYGVVIVENGVVRGIIEKPEEPLSNLVNAGIYKLKAGSIRRYVEELEPSPRGELEFTDAIRVAVERGEEIRAVNIGGCRWIDIGTPWNLLEANRVALEVFMKEGVHGVIEEPVDIRGRVFIGENSVVRRFTSIEGPVYIDRDVSIGPLARIRPYTVVCRGCKIGFSVEIKESIILEDTHISHLAYVGDSIICENVNFGAGTITANLRFDEKIVKMTIRGRRVPTGRRKFGAVVGANVRTGINVSLMPGVKVGANSWIAPGAVVDRDVPDNVFYRVKQEYYIDSLPK